MKFCCCIQSKVKCWFFNNIWLYHSIHLLSVVKSKLPSFILYQFQSLGGREDALYVFVFMSLGGSFYSILFWARDQKSYRIIHRIKKRFPIVCIFIWPFPQPDQACLFQVNLALVIQSKYWNYSLIFFNILFTSVLPLSTGIIHKQIDLLFLQ